MLQLLQKFWKDNASRNLPLIEGKSFPLGFLEGAEIYESGTNPSISIDEIFAFRDKLFASGWVDQDLGGLIGVYAVFSKSVFFEPTGIIRDSVRATFSVCIPIPENQVDPNISFGLVFKERKITITSPYLQSWARDPYHQCFSHFKGMVAGIEAGGSILEIGSRARSGNIHRNFVPETVSYVGLDIREGANVDVVGDAHQLSTYFEPETFDACYSISVFEHLMMPWKVAIEMNKVLKKGAIAFISTHQTFPLHDEPWDFWRFSDKSWHAIFNSVTGFEVVETHLGEPAYIVGSFLNDMTYNMDRARAFMVSQLICRKTGPCNEQWNANLENLVKEIYPH